MRDSKKKRYFLVILPAGKRTDLKKLCGIVKESKLSFASSEALQEKLGLTPGSVSPFGLLNDSNKEVEIYIDREVYDSDIMSFHPNRNTASLELSGDMFRKYLQVIEHDSKVIDL